MWNMQWQSRGLQMKRRLCACPLSSTAQPRLHLSGRIVVYRAAQGRSKPGSEQD